MENQSVGVGIGMVLVGTAAVWFCREHQGDLCGDGFVLISIVVVFTESTHVGKCHHRTTHTYRTKVNLVPRACRNYLCNYL